MCKRSEAKAFLRHGRVTFEGDVVTRPEQRVVVRYVSGPRASKTARLPRGSTTWTFSRRAIFATCFGKAAQKRRRSRRAPLSKRRLYDGVHVDGKPIPVSHVADKENVDMEKEA